jgi:hypothetical protein
MHIHTNTDETGSLCALISSFEHARHHRRRDVLSSVYMYIYIYIYMCIYIYYPCIYNMDLSGFYHDLEGDCDCIMNPAKGKPRVPTSIATDTVCWHQSLWGNCICMDRINMTSTLMLTQLLLNPMVHEKHSQFCSSLEIIRGKRNFPYFPSVNCSQVRPITM